MQAKRKKKEEWKKGHEEENRTGNEHVKIWFIHP